MQTFRHNQIKAAADHVKNGGVIIFPTDTVWGMGCDGRNAAAVQKLRQIKQKPDQAPLIWLVPSLRAAEKSCGPINATERWLLKRKATTVVINGQGVRVIRSGWLNRFLTRCDCPVVATSANRHGQPTLQSWRQAVTTFADADLAVLRGRKILKNRPSAVVMVKDGKLEIFRQYKHDGGISIW